MNSNLDPKELKAMYKALIEVNDIGKNLRPDRSDYILINGMIIVWQNNRQDDEFYGHSIGFLSESILSDLGPIAHIPLYINGDELGSMHTKHKISNISDIEFYDGYIDVVWYDTVEIDEKDILKSFIDGHNANLEENKHIDATDITSDIMLIKKFKEFKEMYSSSPAKMYHRCSISVDIKKIDIALRYINNYKMYIESKQNSIIHEESMDLDEDSMKVILSSNYPLVIKFENGFIFRVMKSLFRAYKSAVISSYIKHVEFSDGLAQNIIIMKHKRITVASSYTCIPIKSKNE